MRLKTKTNGDNLSYLHILKKIPGKVSIGLSGGVDSMVCLNFLLNGKKQVTALHFNHSTENSNLYEEFCREECERLGVKLIVGRCDKLIPKKRSKEDFWREQRYNFFSENNFGNLITCHHLDDVVETWIFSSIHGQPKLIPYSRENIIRPFLLNKKESLYSWAMNNDVNYIEDKTNYESKFARNFIRNKMMKDILHINPGIHKMLKKKLIKKYRGQKDV